MGRHRLRRFAFSLACLALVVASGSVAHSQTLQTLLDEGFESGVTWTVVNQNSCTSCTLSDVQWRQGTRFMSSGSKSLYFGDSGEIDYDLPGTAKGHVTSPSITIPSDALNPSLTFAYRKLTEGSTYWDEARVQILDSSMNVLDSQFLPDKTTNPLTEVLIDLSPYAGQTIYIRFTFDTKDSVWNSCYSSGCYWGIWLDDIRVEYYQPEPPPDETGNPLCRPVEPVILVMLDASGSMDTAIDIPKGTITTKDAIDLTSSLSTTSISLSFRVWMKGQDSSWRDILTVYAIDTSTATKTWLWDSRQSPVYDNDTEGSWSLVTIDLKAAGFRNKNIKLEFTFDAASTGSNSYEGVYLDSISVTIGTTSKFSEGFESNTDQWVIDTYGLEDVFWQRETYRKYAGSWSLYFGNPSIRMFRTKTKWEIAKAALIQMVGDNKDRVKFALASFANNGSCGVDATYDVSLGGDEIDFQTALNGLSPYSNTPIATAIETGTTLLSNTVSPTVYTGVVSEMSCLSQDLMYTYFQQKCGQLGYKFKKYTLSASCSGGKYYNVWYECGPNTNQRPFLLLITDGYETCRTNQDVLDAMTYAAAAGIKSFVLGFGGETDEDLMNQLAVIGGFVNPDGGDTKFFKADNSDGLNDQISKILTLSTQPEICDLIDNDCDGVIDNDVPSETCFNIVCGREGTRSCIPGGLGWSTCIVDTEPEKCDGVDNNCDGQVDETWKIGTPTPLGTTCTVGVGECQKSGVWVCKADGTGVECSVTAGTPQDEVCDNKDNDCDGVIDNDVYRSCSNVCGTVGKERCVAGFYLACDAPTVTNGDKLGQTCTVGVGECQRTGTYICQGDAVVCSVTAGEPSEEICDGKDNNCDGEIDNVENKGTTCVVGKGICQRTGVMVCDLDTKLLKCSVTPGTPETEICNGLDDDSDGTVDNNIPGLGSTCSNGVGACKRDGHMVCDTVGKTLVCDAIPGTPTAEVCNGIDDDCDGTVDESDQACSKDQKPECWVGDTLTCKCIKGTGVSDVYYCHQE
ncbi:MAG: VWA domain-containing protein [Myxococcales bacterium]|nr:VWA domain-containing protein [Myxococcales bacterium]